MINCIIIDDEENARQAFKKIIQRYFADVLHVQALCDSVKTGVVAINRHQPDIVFLDVEMPEENGFALFDSFKEYRFEVIFTTAYKHYAIDAIKYAALDYILKPVNFIDLKEAIAKFSQKQKLLSRQQRIETLLQNVNIGEYWRQKVALPTLDGYQMEMINDIIYCEAVSNYTDIYLKNNKKVLVCKTLKAVEELLPAEIFFRIHKAHLINLNYVKRYVKTDGPRVVLENDTQLDIANRRISDFVQVITGRA